MEIAKCLIPAALSVSVPLQVWAQGSAPQQTAQVNGAQIAYEVGGEGEPLVLLHGIKGIGADGDRDHLLPVGIALEMCEATPESFLWVIPNGDHASVFTLADRFVETVMPFLNGDWKEE